MTPIQHLRARLPLLAILTAPLLAAASQCILSGTLTGMTYAAPIDLDHDGYHARQGTLETRGGVFARAYVLLDTELVGPCANGVEIRPRGHAVFVGGRHVVFAVVDSTRTLCTGDTETVHLTITGGRGDYAGAVGSGTVTLPPGTDTVLEYEGLGYPTMVFTYGAGFELRVR